MAEVALAAEVRRASGSSATRRIRNAGKVPAILYGHGINPTPLAIESRALRVALNTEAGANALLRIAVDGKKHLALARAIQLHPVRNTVAHVDFQIVRVDEVVESEVPLHMIGEADGVTKKDGVIEQVLAAITVSCVPTKIPTKLEVDISSLELNGSIRVKDLKLPEGVTTALDPDEPVVSGVAPSSEESADESADAQGSADVAAKTEKSESSSQA